RRDSLMRHFLVAILVLGSSLSTIGAAEPVVSKTAAGGKAREFAFHYKFRVKDLKSTGDASKDTVRVWLPCPASSDAQDVTRGEATTPAKVSEHQEERFGNRLLYLETKVPAGGEFTVDIPY